MYVTPKSFLTFLSGYKTLYKQRLDNINTLAFRMSSGLSKLVDAAAQVDELRKVLEKNQQEIAEKNVQVEAVRISLLHQQLTTFLIFLNYHIMFLLHPSFADFNYCKSKEERSRNGKGTSASF